MSIRQCMNHILPAHVMRDRLGRSRTRTHAMALPHKAHKHILHKFTYTCKQKTLTHNHQARLKYKASMADMFADVDPTRDPLVEIWEKGNQNTCTSKGTMRSRKMGDSCTLEAWNIADCRSRNVNTNMKVLARYGKECPRKTALLVYANMLIPYLQGVMYARTLLHGSPESVAR